MMKILFLILVGFNQFDNPNFDNDTLRTIDSCLIIEEGYIVELTTPRIRDDRAYPTENLFFNELPELSNLRVILEKGVLVDVEYFHAYNHIKYAMSEKYIPYWLSQPLIEKKINNFDIRVFKVEMVFFKQNIPQSEYCEKMRKPSAYSLFCKENFKKEQLITNLLPRVITVL